MASTMNNAMRKQFTTLLYRMGWRLVGWSWINPHKTHLIKVEMFRDKHHAVQYLADLTEYTQKQIEGFWRQANVDGPMVHDAPRDATCRTCKYYRPYQYSEDIAICTVFSKDGTFIKTPRKFECDRYNRRDSEA